MLCNKTAFLAQHHPMLHWFLWRLFDHALYFSMLG